MLAAIALTPSAPILVPELAGAAAAEVAGLRDAALAAVAALPKRWIVIGVGPADRVIESDSAGSFAGYGVDVPVLLAPDAAATVIDLPLCALTAGWLRGQAVPNACAAVRVFAADHDADAALRFGRALRTEIDAIGEPIGVLVVADGANTLTPSAPGGYDPEALAVQETLDAALATGDGVALGRLPEQITGRVAYQVLAGLTEDETYVTTELARAAPFGVGYFVGIWIYPSWSASTRQSA